MKGAQAQTKGVLNLCVIGQCFRQAVCTGLGIVAQVLNGLKA